ncbi:MAG: calcium-binding protein [Pseudomonadota bacterium]
MTKSSLIIAVSALSLLGFTMGSALAEKGGPGRQGANFQERMAEVDTDGDGTVTRAEFDAAGSARFASVDADGNGSVSLAEFEAQAETKKAERRKRMFDRLDSDGNGELTDGEMRARGARMFEAVDADADGVITQAEMDGARERLKALRAEGGKPAR